MADSETETSPGLIAVSHYIPGREGLFVHIDMSDYLLDYYQHRGQYAPDTFPEHDEKLKELIACFAIHLSARTALETHAWTVHIVADHPYSLFVTGDTGEINESGIAKGFIVGHILTDHIRHTDVNSIHSQFTHRGTTHRSLVQCDSSDIPRMVEQFYRQSEQHEFRVMLSSNSDTALGLVALPEADEEWIRTVDLESLPDASDIERRPMRTCHFQFSCDCSPAKLLPFFRALSQDELNELYGDDQTVQISCPRCGKQFAIDRVDLPASH